MEFPRRAGILLHPTSLPGPYGIGDLGPQAYAFVDFLAGAGQSLWQTLPLGPTDNGNSPYASSSAFAGNTLLISPEQLVIDGLLTTDQLTRTSSLPEDIIDFPTVRASKGALLKEALQARNKHWNAKAGYVAPSALQDLQAGYLGRCPRLLHRAPLVLIENAPMPLVAGSAVL